MSELTKALQELRRRSEITSKARYHAGRRLQGHNWFSQWTLALLAVAQIVLAVAISLGLCTKLNAAYISFSSILIGVLVLTYSLLLGMGNNAARAVKLHQCGMELGRLARQLLVSETNPSTTQQNYETWANEYYDILNKYENHTQTDYLIAKYEYYAPLMRADQDSWFGRLTNWWSRFSRFWWVRVKIYFYHFIQFIHYILSVLLVWGYLAFLVWPSRG